MSGRFMSCIIFSSVSRSLIQDIYIDNNNLSWWNNHKYWCFPPYLAFTLPHTDVRKWKPICLPKIPIFRPRILSPVPEKHIPAPGKPPPPLETHSFPWRPNLYSTHPYPSERTLRAHGNPPPPSHALFYPCLTCQQLPQYTHHPLMPQISFIFKHFTLFSR